MNSISSFVGNLNIAKFALSVISIVFDIIFVIQHYFIYRNNNAVEQENVNLLLNENSNNSKISC